MKSNQLCPRMYKKHFVYDDSEHAGLSLTPVMTVALNSIIVLFLMVLLCYSECRQKHELNRNGPSFFFSFFFSFFIYVAWFESQKFPFSSSRSASGSTCFQ